MLYCLKRLSLAEKFVFLYGFMKSVILKYLSNFILLFVITSCSTTKHVPEGKYLLDDVKIEIEGKNENIKPADLRNYLRQIPNHKVFGNLNLQLGIYNISGKDSTKWYNKWIRKLGAPPVIYDAALTEASALQLDKVVYNMGYLHSQVRIDTFPRPEKKKMRVKYTITPGKSHYINSFKMNFPDDKIREIVMQDSAATLIKINSNLDRNTLDLERQRIATLLRNKGYYAFNKEYITFSADTAAGERNVDITLNIIPPKATDRLPEYDSHRPFYVRNVTFITNYDPMAGIDANFNVNSDTVKYNGINIVYGPDHFLRPGVIDENCFIIPGDPYNAANTDRTYEAFSRLGIIKFININYQVAGEADGVLWLDAIILLSKGKSQNVSFTLEGTNSEGDLGFGVGAAYQHRNIGKGSEILSAKFRASYESLSGDLSGLINDNYVEYSADVGVRFPKFKFPFLKKSFKQKILATTEFATSFGYQERPEYTRIIAGAGWKYHWSEKGNGTRHTFDLLDLNYVYLPESRQNFLDSIRNPLLRYAYEDHLIMKLGYMYYHTNKAQTSAFNKTAFQRSFFTVRAGIETAGNLLYGISSMVGAKKHDGQYRVFGIDYSQYVKLEAEYSYTYKFNTRHMIAWHAGLGIASPYGNSSVIPFEKRFYDGGANGVRGWSVRTLGPGGYRSTNSVTDFINQCGDIRLELNAEYRAKLFWVIELGAFIDAGNIWTIRSYENQPDGVFKFNKFYKQIALAYGLGLRLDFTYFLLRLDLGMKAHNPAMGEEEWPIIHPNWKRDAAFHFSVGYPF